MGLRVMSFKLPQRMYSQIRKRAARRGVSPSDMARLILITGLESDPRRLNRVILPLLAHRAVYPPQNGNKGHVPMPERVKMGIFGVFRSRKLKHAEGQGRA